MAKKMTNAIHAVFIHTTDLVQSAAWYCKLLALPFDPSTVQEPVFNVQVDGETYLTIDSHANDPDFSFVPGSGPVFNFFSEDLITTYQWISEQGFQISREIEKDKDFGWFQIQDPDQNVVMICGTIKK